MSLGKIGEQAVVGRFLEVVRSQWRTVFFPAVALWLLATFVAGTLTRSFDILEYSAYAHAALNSPLFHSLPKEYPAPALLIFVLPLVVPFSYPWVFAVPVGFVLITLTTSYLRTSNAKEGVESAQRLIIYLLLGAVMFLTARYDIFAAAAAFWAVRAARQNRWSAAWTWSSIGFAIKLFPAVVWPVLLIAEWRLDKKVPWRRAIWVAVCGALVFGVPALLNSREALGPLTYYLHRPAEIGGLPAGLALVFDPNAWHYLFSFHSSNVQSPVVGPISAVLAVVGVAGYSLVWWQQAVGRLPVEAAALATLTLTVLCSKVLSVQYVIWLIPFWALYRIRISWIVACCVNSLVFLFVLTTGFSPFLSDNSVYSLTLLYFARDLLILVGSVAWLRDVLTQGSKSVNRAVHSASPRISERSAG